MAIWFETKKKIEKFIAKKGQINKKKTMKKSIHTHTHSPLIEKKKNMEKNKFEIQRK